jgi:hypothetical protein
MAWMQCRGCSAKFAVGLLRCPQCKTVSELFAVPEEVIEAEQEATVPKISVEGGPSSALGGEAEQPAAVGDEAQPSVEVPADAGDAAVAESSPEDTEESEPDVEAAPEPDAVPAPAAKKRVAKKTAASPES